mmetsp:Transcript_41894/g.103167  ORF Transcript_41894/g.103167 Transcript_41894/m.103167 type:complete len:91 (-) Transcript_41894:581-853(-)
MSLRIFFSEMCKPLFKSAALSSASFSTCASIATFTSASSLSPPAVFFAFADVVLKTKQNGVGYPSLAALAISSLSTLIPSSLFPAVEVVA